MLFKGTIIGPASGSIAGITASHNSAGQYMRNRTVPVNPNTVQQMAIRNAMSQLVAAWGNTLTAAQRNAWATYAANVTVLNRLGDPINLSPLNMFIRGNINRLTIAQPLVAAGPTVMSLNELTAPSAAVVTGGLTATIGFTNTDSWAVTTGGFLLIFSSRQQGPTTNYFKGPYRLAGIKAGVTGTPPSSPATVTLPFPCAIGNQIFFRVVAITADGRQSSDFRTSDFL